MAKFRGSTVYIVILYYYNLQASGFLKTYNSSESPYLIGLTGGIATGKSSIFKRLVGKGACGVDCDKLGHDAYRTGTLAHSKIVEEFGEGTVLGGRLIATCSIKLFLSLRSAE